MKKKLIALGLALAFLTAPIANAQVGGSAVGGLNLWKLSSPSILPVLSSYILNSSTTPLTNAHFTQLSTGFIIGTSTATSTFAGGIELTGGCFKVGGTCLSSGGVTGTGAANKLAYFTSAYALSYNDLFHWDNTNVALGVGSSSPWAKLSVGSNTGGTGPLFAIASSTGSGATSTYAWMDAFGNFGIGTTTPGAGALFGVNGASFFGGAITSTGAIVSTTVDTGQGANELYAMNQAVQTSNSPSFASLSITTTNATSTFSGNVDVQGNLKATSTIGATFSTTTTTGTTTYYMRLPANSVNVQRMRCHSDTGTFVYDFYNGTASSTLACTTSASEKYITSNNNLSTTTVTARIGVGSMSTAAQQQVIELDYLPQTISN